MTYYLGLFPFLFLITLFSFSQSELSAQTATGKQLEIEDLTRWNQMEDTKISNDGRWVVYTLDAEEGDPSTIIYDGQNDQDQTFERADNFQISYDNRFLVFMIHPLEEAVKDMRRRKVDKKALPGDTLAILRLSDQQLVKIPEVKSYKLPEKWSGRLAYMTLAAEPVDTSQSKKNKKQKEYNRLVIRNLENGEEIEIDKAQDYELAEAGNSIAWITNGETPGVYHFNSQSEQINSLHEGKGTYKHLTFDKPGSQLAFVADLDTTETRVRPYGLYHYGPGKDAATLALAAGSGIMEPGWTVSEHLRLRFSEDGGRLFFGLAPPPILPDTSLLEEEIPVVEVWSTGDSRMYTRQKYN